MGKTLKVSKSWIGTAAEVSQLPEPIRAYIRKLEDEADQLRAYKEAAEKQEPVFYCIGGDENFYTNTPGDLELAKKFDWPVTALYAKPVPANQEQKLDKPARVHATEFMPGVPVRAVVEAAQRYYEWRKKNNPRRISDYDASEIAFSVNASSDRHGFDVDKWLNKEGEELLKRLNGEES